VTRPIDDQTDTEKGTRRFDSPPADRMVRAEFALYLFVSGCMTVGGVVAEFVPALHDRANNTSVFVFGMAAGLVFACVVLLAVWVVVALAGLFRPSR
jgi:hypothetical protein